MNIHEMHCTPLGFPTGSPGYSLTAKADSLFNISSTKSVQPNQSLPHDSFSTSALSFLKWHFHSWTGGFLLCSFFPVAIRVKLRPAFSSFFSCKPSRCLTGCIYISCCVLLLKFSSSFLLACSHLSYFFTTKTAKYMASQ